MYTVDNSRAGTMLTPFVNAPYRGAVIGSRLRSHPAPKYFKTKRITLNNKFL
jgi:hypothetical protein